MNNEVPNLPFIRLATRAQDIVNINKGIFGKKELPRDLAIMLAGRIFTGKTKLVEYLQGEEYNNEYSHSTSEQRHELGTFGRDLFFAKKAIALDHGGEYENDLEDMMSRARPHGIIFIVDHENRLDHKIALSRFAKFVNARDHLFRLGGKKARSRLRTVLILVNKMDRWQHQFLRIGEMNPDYMNLTELRIDLQGDMDSLRNNNITVQFEACSIETRNNLDGALTNFLISIIEGN